MQLLGVEFAFSKIEKLFLAEHEHHEEVHLLLDAEEFVDLWIENIVLEREQEGRIVFFLPLYVLDQVKQQIGYDVVITVI